MACTRRLPPRRRVTGTGRELDSVHSDAESAAVRQKIRWRGEDCLEHGCLTVRRNGQSARSISARRSLPNKTFRTGTRSGKETAEEQLDRSRRRRQRTAARAEGMRRWECQRPRRAGVIAHPYPQWHRLTRAVVLFRRLHDDRAAFATRPCIPVRLGAAHGEQKSEGGALRRPRHPLMESSSRRSAHHRDRRCSLPDRAGRRPSRSRSMPHLCCRWR